MLGLDIRRRHEPRCGSAEWIYDSLTRAGQAENKLHKTQLASDRTSCRSALANQPSRSPHRRLLVDAHRARRHSQSPGIGHCRVRDAASWSLENRRPCRRDREPHPPCVRRRVPKPICSAACQARCSRSVRNRPGLRLFTRPIPPTRTNRVMQNPVKKPDGNPRQPASPASDVKNDRALVNRSG